MPALQEIFGDFISWKSLREHQKINYPILWDGHPARPCIISGLFGPHYKKFWDIF
jgi:hypothetical protein